MLRKAWFEKLYGTELTRYDAAMKAANNDQNEAIKLLIETDRGMYNPCTWIAGLYEYVRYRCDRRLLAEASKAIAERSLVEYFRVDRHKQEAVESYCHRFARDHGDTPEGLAKKYKDLVRRTSDGN